MKKLILSIAALLCIAPGVNAQNNGKFWTGGSIGYEYSKVKDGIELNNYNIMPEFGYNFTDNLGVGIRLGYAHQEFADGVAGTKVKLDGFAAEPFVRYAFLKGNFGGIFADGGAGYIYSKNKTTDTKVHQFEVGISPGVYVNVTDKVMLTGRFGFLGYQYEKNGDVKTNTFGADFDMGRLELGVNILF